MYEDFQLKKNEFSKKLPERIRKFIKKTKKNQIPNLIWQT
jgi:hypothetical protein